jgi:hypothetical protein
MFVYQARPKKFAVVTSLGRSSWPDAMALQQACCRAWVSHPRVIVRRMFIDCDECVMQATEACDDCVVTHILGREPGHAVVLDLAEERALRTMSDAGLVPGLLHLPRADDRDS